MEMLMNHNEESRIRLRSSDINLVYDDNQYWATNLVLKLN
jgi:hypothetical protein